MLAVGAEKAEVMLRQAYLLRNIIITCFGESTRLPPLPPLALTFSLSLSSSLSLFDLHWLTEVLNVLLSSYEIKAEAEQLRDENEQLRSQAEENRQDSVSDSDSDSVSDSVSVSVSVSGDR